MKTESNKLLIFIIVLFISNLMITYNLIASYYEKNKYKLYIKKLFGYSILRKNRILILSLFLIYIAPVTAITILYGNKILLSGLILILIESVIFIIIDRLIATKSFNSIIKGEH